MRKKYSFQGVSLEKKLLMEIEKHIKNSKKYSTVTAFIRYSVVKQLEREKMFK